MLDVVDNLRTTGADGIMSAEGLLDDPALFARGHNPSPTSSSSSSSSPSTSSSSSPPDGPSRLSLALEYLDLVQVVTKTFAYMRTHVAHLAFFTLHRLLLVYSFS